MTKEQLLTALQEKRNQLGFSQSEVAEKLGISQGQYARLESGKSEITIEKLFALCNLLEIDLVIKEKQVPKNDKVRLIIKNLSDIIENLQDL